MQEFWTVRWSFRCLLSFDTSSRSWGKTMPILATVASCPPPTLAGSNIISTLIASNRRRRNENLAARRDAKLATKKEKREKKLVRAGFEGRKDGFIEPKAKAAAA